jgi:hypothetical protein
VASGICELGTCSRWKIVAISRAATGSVLVPPRCPAALVYRTAEALAGAVAPWSCGIWRAGRPVDPHPHGGSDPL